MTDLQTCIRRNAELQRLLTQQGRALKSLDERECNPVSEMGVSLVEQLRREVGGAIALLEGVVSDELAEPSPTWSAKVKQSISPKQKRTLELTALQVAEASVFTLQGRVDFLTAENARLVSDNTRLSKVGCEKRECSLVRELDHELTSARADLSRHRVMWAEQRTRFEEEKIALERENAGLEKALLDALSKDQAPTIVTVKQAREEKSKNADKARRAREAAEVAELKAATFKNEMEAAQAHCATLQGKYAAVRLQLDTLTHKYDRVMQDGRDSVHSMENAVLRKVVDELQLRIPAMEEYIAKMEAAKGPKFAEPKLLKKSSRA